MSEISQEYPALACGYPRDEGVIVAYIPALQGLMMAEHLYRDGKRTFTVYSLDGVVLDMLPHDRKGCKWWMVREAARALKLDYPEPVLACAAEDFRVSCLPRIEDREGQVLAFRSYSRGPWVTLQKEAPSFDGENKDENGRNEPEPAGTTDSVATEQPEASDVCVP